MLSYWWVLGRMEVDGGLMGEEGEGGWGGGFSGVDIWD